MAIVQVQFNHWDKVYNFDSGEIRLDKGDFVIVETEMGTEIAQVVGFKKDSNHDCEECGGCKEKINNSSVDSVDSTGSPQASSEQAKLEKEENKREIKTILRKATLHDKEKITSKENKHKALDYCKDLVKKHKLQMKLVDVHFAFDDSRITFAFIADGRVDFRELVKDLTRHYNKTIRLHQIGIRDEAKIMGDYGHCGQELCCRKFLENLNSITSEMAEKQQVVHRGSDRISGMCGRLMCCLAYEEEGYEELSKTMPVIGTKVNVDGKHGVVIGRNILKQSVNVSFPPTKGESGMITEIDLNRNKK